MEMRYTGVTRSSSTGILKAKKKYKVGSQHLPNELPECQAKSDAYAKRLEKGDDLSHLSSFTQASKSSTKRSVLARGVQCYNSYFGRSNLPSTIGEDKVR
ncbi:hypothetical protein F511_44874 [Dorcoceras hygrometricum]|uniref:Uncharacterized protein n=1 Tax=Dorcoceras hygrometricum TaxID=472368 RepID=A0A2Z7CSW7_9LAMI|nr:hypothetical protein F511_44874 [Dorcoceras hygrometricum]